MNRGLLGDDLATQQPKKVKLVKAPTVTARPNAPAIIQAHIAATTPPWSAPTELPSLAGVSRISVDLETCDPDLRELGPGPRRPGSFIAGIAVGTDDGRRFYLPVRHQGGGNLDEGMIQRWARSELNSFQGEVVGANLIYDLDFLNMWDVRFPSGTIFHDVQIAEPLIDEWRFSYKLEILARDYLGEGKTENLLRQFAELYGWKTDDEVKANIWRLPAHVVGPYAEGDVDLPLRIFPLQQKRLEEEDLMEVYGVERRLIPCLLAMRLRGVRINEEKVERVKSELTQARDLELAKLKRLAGPAAEFMAPDSFAQAILDRGLNPSLTLKTKKMSITSAFLERNEGDDLVDAIQRGRKLNTIINTFIDGHIGNHLINGRLHCEFHQLKNDDSGTIARLSSSNPNLQNIPARDKIIAPLIRGLFEPEPGEVWERLDESQVEYRLLVNYAVGGGAEEARNKYRNDPSTDFHKFVAELMGVDPDDDYLRKRVKGVNFAKSYGAQKKKLAALLKCSIEDASDFVDKYERSMPFAKDTFDAAQRWAANRGYIVTYLRRRQRFPLWEPVSNYGSNKKPPLHLDEAKKAYGNRLVRAYVYTALNRKLQGSAADLMKKAMVDSWEAGVYNELGGAPLLTVHDELDTSSSGSSAAEEAMRDLKDIMENCLVLKVPLICDRKSGANWGEV